MHALLLVTALIMAIIPQCVKASERHHHEITNVTNVSNQYVSDGSLALAMAASGMNASSGTGHTQILLSGGYMDSENAGILGIAKRFCESCPLLQGSIGTVNGETGYGVSAVWIIK